MTFDEVERLLPNGFHDAFLCALSVDYVNRTANMELEVWVGIIKSAQHDRLNSIDYLCAGRARPRTARIRVPLG